MILYQIPPKGEERLAEVLDRSSLGELYVELEDGTKRWISSDWILEEE